MSTRSVSLVMNECFFIPDVYHTVSPLMGSKNALIQKFIYPSEVFESLLKEHRIVFVESGVHSKTLLVWKDKVKEFQGEDTIRLQYISGDLYKTAFTVRAMEEKEEKELAEKYRKFFFSNVQRPSPSLTAAKPPPRAMSSSNSIPKLDEARKGCDCALM